MKSKEMLVRTRAGVVPNPFEKALPRFPVRTYSPSNSTLLAEKTSSSQAKLPEKPQLRERVINPEIIEIPPGKTYLTNIPSLEGRNFVYLFEPKVKPFFLAFSAGLPGGFINFIVRHKQQRDAQISINGKRPLQVQQLNLGDVINIDNGFFLRVEKEAVDGIWCLCPVAADEALRIKNNQIERISETTIRLPDARKVATPLILGRETANFFTFETLSRQHIRVTVFPNHLELANLNAKNGVMAEGVKFGKTETRNVYEGNTLYLGNIPFMVSLDAEKRWTLRLITIPPQKKYQDGVTYSRAVRQRNSITLFENKPYAYQVYDQELPPNQREKAVVINLPNGGKAIITSGSEIPFGRPAVALINRTIHELVDNKESWKSIDSITQTYQEIVNLSSVRLKALLTLCQKNYPHVYLKWLTGRHNLPSAIGASLVLSSFAQDSRGNQFLVYAQIGRAHSWLIHSNNNGGISSIKEISFQPQDAGSSWYLSELDATVEVVPEPIKVIPLDSVDSANSLISGMLIYVDTRSQSPYLPQRLPQDELALLINQGKASLTEKIYQRLDSILAAWVKKQGNPPEEAVLAFINPPSITQVMSSK